MPLISFLPIPSDSHFPLQNLPYGVFTPPAGGAPRVGVAIGDQVLDLAALWDAGLFANTAVSPTPLFAQPTLNLFMAAGSRAWAEARAAIQTLLRADNPRLRDDAAVRARALWPQAGVTLHLPARIGDYTDFYSSKEHASNVGRMFGRETPLLDNWLHLPVGYHGRASSVVLSGTPIRRPHGQLKPPGAAAPIFGPTQELDFELELGFFVGPGNALGEPIPIDAAAEHIFGLVLVNDWSARDMQRWEYRPLGPFLAKNFATSISPWVVPLAALAPFRVAGPLQEPAPLPYLQTAVPWAFDIHLEVHLQTARMAAPAVIARSNARHLYWHVAQQLVHHASSGCNLQPGDLLATGTISGPTPDSCGSLLELAWRGTRPLTLPSGEQRAFLADGDRLTLTGWCQGDGYRIGFGEVAGTIG
ncbi:MAG: fumarylacetoacetase [Anaerolineales bacterium]|nr:fumarylacetoacetase [Anaerolineales bacterium]